MKEFLKNWLLLVYGAIAGAGMFSVTGLWNMPTEWVIGSIGLAAVICIFPAKIITEGK